MSDEQLFVFAAKYNFTCGGGGKHLKIEVIKIIPVIFWNRIIKRLMTLHVFSVGTHSFSGGGCTQSPDPSGRDTGLVWLEWSGSWSPGGGSVYGQILPWKQVA